MRITAGTMRGRRLFTPPGRQTRPTASMVREAVFNIIGHKIYDASFLDVFAGSGLMTFEALSRGANNAVMIDRSRDAIKTIRKNIEVLDCEDQVEIYSGDALHMLKMLKEKKTFDIAYIDPPYDDKGYKKVLNLFFDGLDHKDAIAIYECSSKDEIEIESALYRLIDSRKYGLRSINIFKKDVS